MPPSSCSLDPADRDARVREWQSLRDDALISERPTEAGALVTFARNDEVMCRLEALIEAEGACCSFLHFELTDAGERIHVEVTSSATAAGPRASGAGGL